MPTQQDMQTSLEDCRFFHQKLDPIIRGPEEDQDLELIRRYFRAYLHCWKSVFYFVREEKGLNKNAWITWCENWQVRLSPGDRILYNYLRKTRDHDTHSGMITVKKETAMGLFPIVMFQPANQPEVTTELISCCVRGLAVIEQLIQDYASIE